MLTSYSGIYCILKMIHMNRIVIGEWKPIFLILFVGSEVSIYTRQKNKDGRYRYSRGGDSLRFKVVGNADCRQTVSCMSNEGSESSRESHGTVTRVCGYMTMASILDAIGVDAGCWPLRGTS
jgi:hypothetical protein